MKIFKNKKNATVGVFLLLLYIPWVMVSMVYIENSNWLTHIGVCALVTFVGVVASQIGENDNNN